jgi:hypothetical protein
MKRLLAAVIFVLALAFAGPLRAQPTGTLHCWQGGSVCARVVVPISMGGLNLVTKSVEAGAFTGGLGLGLDLWGGALTPAIAVTGSAASAAQNYLDIAGIVGLFRYFWVGTKVHITPAFDQWYLLGGIDPLAIVDGIVR